MPPERSVDWIREQLRHAGLQEVRAASGRQPLISESILVCVHAKHYEREIYNADGSRVATAAVRPDVRGWKPFSDLTALDFTDASGELLLGVTVSGDAWGRRVTARAPDGRELATIALGGLRKGVIKSGATELGRLKRVGALRAALRSLIRPRFELLDTHGAVVCRISERAANVFEFTDDAGAQLRALVPAVDLAVRKWQGDTNLGAGG